MIKQIFVNKTKIRTDIFPLFSHFFELFLRKMQKKYKLPCCYDNKLMGASVAQLSERALFTSAKVGSIPVGDDL